MKKKFNVTVGIYDAVTTVKLTQISESVECRTQQSAETHVLRRAEVYVVCEWVLPRLSEHYGVDENTLLSMAGDGLIDLTKGYEYRIERSELCE